MREATHPLDASLTLPSDPLQNKDSGEHLVSEHAIATLIRVMPRLSHVYKAQLRAGPLTPQQFFTLIGIRDAMGRCPDGAQPGKLARHCVLSGPGMTAVIDDLVSGGYCVRTHSAKDRRAVFVRLTEHGQQILNAMSATAAAGTKDILGPIIQEWSPERTVLFMKMLSDLESAADQAIQGW